MTMRVSEDPCEDGMEATGTILLSSGTSVENHFLCIRICQYNISVKTANHLSKKPYVISNMIMRILFFRVIVVPLTSRKPYPHKVIFASLCTKLLNSINKSNHTSRYVKRTSFPLIPKTLKERQSAQPIPCIKCQGINYPKIFYLHFQEVNFFQLSYITQHRA